MSEEIQRKILLPPEVERLKRVDKMLGDESEYNPLTDLTDEQIFTIAQYEAFNDYLQKHGIDGGIDPIIQMLLRYCHLAPSKNRMGRQEAVTILKSAPVYAPNLPGDDEPEKPGFIARLLGGGKK